MSDLSIFKFENCELRTVVVDGVPFFVGKDVALALGYANPTDALNTYCRGVQKLYPIVDSLGRSQKVRIISESDVLLIIIGSKLPSGIQATKVLLKSVSDISGIIKALAEFEVPDDLPDMYVYAIKNTVTGNVKLGISRDPQSRLKQLQTGNDCELKLIATRKAENRFADEVALHQKYSDLRIQGEWFSSEASLS